MQRIGFLLQNLLFAQHVSGTIMPIIRNSRVIQMAAVCGTWFLGLQVVGLVWSCGLCIRFAGYCSTGQLSSNWSGVELWVMCPVCGILLDWPVEQYPTNRTHNSQLHTRPITCKPKNQVPRAAAIYITLELLMMGIMVPETCWANNKFCN